MGYYPPDGIYPTYGAFVKSLNDPRTPKEKNFAKAQEGVRKDVECAFGVLQTRFAIVSGPSRMWDRDTLHDIMTVCIILYNMIVEEKRKSMEIGHADNSERIADERQCININHVSTLPPSAHFLRGALLGTFRDIWKSETKTSTSK
ncbi:hypothetical protein PHYBLDRAFT_173908 [Phycomyces blakesleeanus NRRL 1555(-)]|uniref:DDE Tnp4 domain-containing protein n=1 Tax=Phycomyces blakesleeanus (strain ATCC 8743b / DSM 1359 / FGSC 10004 / NBRC 33097 / NRRL 1555) TaxID=763407 RepID=A0A167KFR0_PHYB8|nr:hypothetical protein PHYBLDRAFT_173908 [Phycomyces blakesleeanus NRRL 1555(-)]OAD67997.1 hypothetical protein PHYBLDRAFT_173908 [Phycomyces blakesleeanus NRRL 1555(-)]|eukprot:XP_018286037.1 hypothetical protein PHYBLDRAFT_173908 [Phycomyces blakesleeanus NRRL 1555(-)]